MNHDLRKGLRTWVEIDTRAIAKNYTAFRNHIPPSVRLCGVVKSNAYGHGLVQFAQELEKLGADMLAVDSVVEALTLRREGVRTPILVLGYTLPDMYEKVLEKNIHLTISSKESLDELFSRGYHTRIPIHIKVDTGMHRQGFLEDEREVLMDFLEKKGFLISGLYTHFAKSKDFNDRTFTESSIEVFLRWREDFKKRGKVVIAHADATGGLLVHPEAHFDMVRIGIGLYGMPAADTLATFHEETMPLHPVLTWKTIVSEIKEIPEGSSIGYDGTHVTKRPTKMMVCPIGYWHGYPRALSNNAEVLVRGKRAPVLGRVSMDMIVVDGTDIPGVRVSDEVVLVGAQEGEEISATELAHRAGTSEYELLTRLNPLMRKIYR